MKLTPADKWFSRCVRERAEWTCERCGKRYTPPTQALHCAHYETRDHWGTRFEPINALSLCHGCHQYFDKGRRFEFDEFHAEIFGEYAKGIIKELAFNISHMKAMKRTGGKGAIAKHYKEEYERMMNERAAGVTGRLEFVGYE